MFESSVNSEGIEAKHKLPRYFFQFESSVNSEGIEARISGVKRHETFESSVNSEGIEALDISFVYVYSLRAV